MSMTLSGNGTITGLVSGGLPDATITSAELASHTVDSQTLTLLNASGSAPVYACRAWVNFKGTGTVAIYGSGNVSSITDNGTGNYVVNFTTAMPDTNYGITVGAWNNGTGNGGWICYGTGTGSYPAGVSTSSLGIVSFSSAGADTDQDSISVAVHR